MLHGAQVLLREGTPYVLCQRVLDSPLLVNDVKVTLRFYLALSFLPGRGLQVHVWDDGQVSAATATTRA